MHRIEEVIKIILDLQNDIEYLELGNVHALIYPLQKLTNEEWEELCNQIDQWNGLQRMILITSILEIKDNKASNFDTSIILAKAFILSELRDSEVLIEDLEFLDNDIPKDIDLVNQIFDKIKWLERKSKYYEIHFEEKHKLINKLYINVIC